MSDESKRGKDEIEICPIGCNQAFFRRWRGGQLIASGVGAIGRACVPDVGDTCVEYCPVQANGRHPETRSYTVNSQGSVSHSRASTPEYRSGWDRIFAARKASSAPN